MNKKSLEKIVECCNHSLYHDVMSYEHYYSRAVTDIGIIKGLAESVLNELESSQLKKRINDLELWQEDVLERITKLEEKR